MILKCVDIYAIWGTRWSGPGGGGDVHMKRSGMLVKPQNETYLDLFAKIK